MRGIRRRMRGLRLTATRNIGRTDIERCDQFLHKLHLHEGIGDQQRIAAHRSRKMRQFTEANTDWLTVFRLPAYAPDLNAVEGAWASMKSSLGNHAATTLDELETMVRSRLRQIQRRPDLINALLGQTGLSLEPPPR